MAGDFFAWAMAHPIDMLGLMTGMAVLAGLLALAPEMREQISRHHPRC